MLLADPQLNEPAIQPSWIAVVPLYLLALLGFTYALYAGYQVARNPEGYFSQLVIRNGAFAIGLPAAALGAYCVIFLFPHAKDKGELSIKAWQVEVKGPACQALLWMMCFAIFIWAGKQFASLKHPSGPTPIPRKRGGRTPTKEDAGKGEKQE
jgi:hypothetical protein